MANQSELSGDKLVLGYMSEYLDGELPGALTQPFAQALTGKEHTVADFQKVRGRFQVVLGQFLAPEPLKHRIRNLVQDDQLRETMEASHIQDVERAEVFSNILRRATLTAIVLGIIGFAIYIFMPQSGEKINVVEYVGYEAIAMEEDPDGRINLPTSDLEEVRQFVTQVPGLNFTPQVLRPLNGWVPSGVSIIDYDVTKVVAVMYKSPERNNEHLHHFMFAGNIKDIPYSGEEADYRGIRYRVYASDKLNILVWQLNPNMVSALAGHRSAPELAEIARSGTPE